MDIHNGLRGSTTVVMENPDHSRVFARQGGLGYVQHPFPYGTDTFTARTYYLGGGPDERFYRGYSYRGAYIEVYAPARYYPGGFYGWAYNPWAAPVPYAWGWAGNPWYGYYGPYFTPYPSYASASLWLTDYLISQSLAASYQAQVAAQLPLNAPLPAGQAALTPDVKQAIADEVQRQIALENAEAQTNAQNGLSDPASSGIVRMLSDNGAHSFVVGDDLDVVGAGGQACAISPGDVLQLTAAPPANASVATLMVMASKGGVECAKGSSVQVALSDLQDMQNYMREVVDQGLSQLQGHQGGLPTPPQSALVAAAPAAFSLGAPPPDQTVATQINQEFQQGTQAEQAALGQTAPPALAPILAPIAPPAAPSSAPPSGGPPKITLGQTTDQVVAILGQPKDIVDLGAKKIYVYPAFKITFNNGAVADVE